MAPRVLVRVTRARSSSYADIQLRYQTEGSVGIDLRASILEDIKLYSGERKLIPSGWKIAIPSGYEGQVRPRSGLALNNGITVLNAPGTIDSDYRGEIGVILVNLGVDAFTVHNGDRIAQLVICPVERAQIVEVLHLDETVRSEDGFGSTGVA